MGEVSVTRTSWDVGALFHMITAALSVVGELQRVICLSENGKISMAMGGYWGIVNVKTNDKNKNKNKDVLGRGCPPSYDNSC